MKHPVILDACTIINLLRIDEDEFLFKSIISLDLNIASTVYQEVSININKNSLSKEQKKNIEQAIPSFLKVSKKEDAIINDISQEVFDKLCQFTFHNKKYNGELLSSALSLCISREKNSRVYFYTDDFPAKKQFSPYFSYQQIGVIGDSVDLLLFLYWTKSDFSKKRLLKYLQDLKSEYNTPLKQLINKIQTKKDSFSNKENKDTSLIVNVNKILDGYFKSNAQLMNEGIIFFNSSKKYYAIKDIIKQFPNIDNECILSKKVRYTIQFLSSFEIFKIA